MLLKLYLLKKRNIILALCVLMSAVILITTTLLTAIKPAVATIYERPVMRVETQEKKLALSVNVDEKTDVEFLLSAFGENKATFFISEEFENRYGDKVKSIIAQGHTVGILEEDLDGMSIKEIRDRLAERIEKLSFLIGKNCELVRADSNRFDAQSVRTVFSLGLYPVQWSTDDTTEHFSAGDIVLITCESDVAAFVQKITADGYVTTTVDGLIFDT